MITRNFNGIFIDDPPGRCYSSNMDEPTKQHLLVAVSGSPNSTYLIHWTHRMAADMGAGWTAIHVISTEKHHYKLSKDALDENLLLAKSLGAHLVTIHGNDIAGEIINYSRIHRVTHIISGKSGPSDQRSLFRKKSISEIIIDNSENIDVLFLQDQGRTPPQKTLLKKAGKSYP